MDHHNEAVDVALLRRSRVFDEEARAWGVSSRVALALFAFPLAGALLIALDLIHGAYAARLLQEDSVVEWATALAIFTTAVVSTIVASMLWRDGLHVQAVAYALLALASILAAGEEVSWGQRLFGFGTPQSLRGANEQEEFNVHNLGAVYPLYLVGMLFVGLYGSVGSWFVYRFKRWWTPNWCLFMPPVFLAGAFIQLAGYRLIRYTGAPGHDYGEWCECCVAVAIAVFVALNARRLRTVNRFEGP